MSIGSHKIFHEFPNEHQLVQRLIDTNNHFAAIVERYHAVDRIVCKMEAERTVSAKKECDVFKRQRLRLKDQLFLLMIKHKTEEESKLSS